MDFNTNDFTLVLSGGGALGIAHLGVLHDMHIAGLVPREIVGTSMGGIIGASMAIGLSEPEIYRLIVRFSKVQKWVQFSWNGNAIIIDDKIEKIFEEIFGSIRMDETSIPLKLIATNTVTGHRRVFDRNDKIPLVKALLASMAIPGIFEEQSIEEQTYSDGFLCENLGITQASYDDVLAVDVLGRHSFEKSLPSSFFKTKNVLDMFERSIRLLIYNQTQSNLRHSNKNICMLEPKTYDYRTFDFHKYKEIRELGLGLLEDCLQN